MTIKVKSEVTVYEVNGTDTKGCPLPTIGVDSHWNRSQFVVLVVNGERVTVSAKDIAAAIANATNTARFGL